MATKGSDDPKPTKGAGERKKVIYNAKGGEAKDIQAEWWLAPEERVHEGVFAVVNKVRSSQKFRSERNLIFARLYQNTEISGLANGAFTRINQSQTFLENRVSYNVSRSCIDTAASKIAKNRPRPLFMTEKGNWNLKRRAQKLTQFMTGLFDQMGTGSGDARSLYGIGRRCFVDGAAFGTGVVKLYKDKANATVRAERVFPDELVVDELEGLYEQPMQMHQEKLVHRSVLLTMFPKKKKEIMILQSGLEVNTSAESSADMVRLIESWRLPSGPDAGDGRHAWSVENCTLFAEDWKKDYFPFAFFRWAPRLMGFWGSGLIEELLGIQLEINKILRNIQLAQHLMAVPQVWLEAQSQALAKHINNQIGGIKYYVGQEPKFYTPTAMTPEVYAHLESLIRKAYEITGISQLSATSKKPEGLDSGKALREYNDIESERFMLTGMRYEDFHMDVTWIALDMLDDLSAEGLKPEVWIKNGGWDEKLKWSDVKIPKNQYVLRPFPTGLLPSRPEGKLAAVQELVQGGFFDREESLELLDYPDLDDTISIKLAPRTDAKRLLERMIDSNSDDAYESPEPFMNISYAASLAQSYYLRGRGEGMPEEKLELLRRFMDECKARIDEAKAQEMQMQADAQMQASMAAQGGGMAPLAAPEAPPTSDIIPNAPAA